jgi:hypothetical protein
MSRPLYAIPTIKVPDISGLHQVFGIGASPLVLILTTELQISRWPTFTIS